MTHDPTHRNIVWQRGEVSAADRASFSGRRRLPSCCKENIRRIAEVARLFNDARMM
ncbi:MAG: hypothetical protein IPH54_04120 [Rhodoferax sp.]|nr:hypothetical protein [Rhodoferax sp.]